MASSMSCALSGAESEPPEARRFWGIVFPASTGILPVVYNIRRRGESWLGRCAGDIYRYNPQLEIEVNFSKLTRAGVVGLKGEQNVVAERDDVPRCVHRPNALAVPGLGEVFDVEVYVG